MTFNPNQIMNYQSVYTESPDEQIESTTLQVVSGSEITYQPTIHSDYVFYEISFSQDYAGDKDIRVNYYLESGSLGGSFSEIEGCIRNHGINDGSVKDKVNLSFAIPSWTGYKSLRLATNAYSNSYRSRLHRTSFWEGSANTSKINSVRLELFSLRNQ